MTPNKNDLKKRSEGTKGESRTQTQRTNAERKDRNSVRKNKDMDEQELNDQNR